ncbi:MAG: chemotaxis protein CheA [Pseudomonadota bacterium]
MTGRGVSSPGMEAFVEEASELLETLEGLLLALEGTPSPDRVDEVFRALHTIKGSGAMFGFESLAGFVHHFEDAFDRVRSGTLPVDRQLVDLSLAARDRIAALLEAGPDAASGGDAAAQAANAEETRALVTAITALLGEAGARNTSATQTDTAASGPAAAGAAQRVKIQFRPAPGSLLGGMRPELLVEEVAALGTAEITVKAGAVPALEEIDPTACYLGWEIDLLTEESLATIEAVFIFADDADLTIEAATTPPSPEEPAAPSPVASPVTAPAPTSPDPKPSTAPSDAPAASGLASARKPASGGKAAAPAASRGENVRVPASRLDDLMDQLGELVIAQSRLQQVAARLGDGALSNLVEEIDRHTTGLRDTTLSLRMLPIEVVFGKFRRVVRDLSASLGKDVALVTQGGETEIDKTVIDRLSEPLVHMIRNAMDHGIEDGETRAAAGKAGGGTITLSAWQEGGDVVIEIADDGAGLNTAAIRARAEERGLIAPEAEITEQEIHQLIFAPGFSTAKTLSNVSGRGVGMDAVRSAVDQLRGRISVQTEPGQGTRMALSLPVSLAIIDSFLIGLDEQIYVLPLAVVEECVEEEVSEGGVEDSGRRMIELRDRLVPYIDLRTLFGSPPADRARHRIVIVRSNGTLLGLVVDDILGQNQTVIKALAPHHQRIGGYAGATILGDGRVALILDVGALAERAMAERALARPQAVRPRGEHLPGAETSQATPTPPSAAAIASLAAEAP